jgi:hypothetical protein
VETPTDGVGGSGLDADYAKDYRLMDILGARRPLRESSIVRQLTRIENKLRNLKLCSMEVPALKCGVAVFVVKS